MSKEIFTLLIVLTSHDQLGETDEKTGFWLEEFTTPYYVFLDAGAQITLASPNGGKPPIDPRSLDKDAQTVSTQRFLSDEKANQLLANSVRLSEVNAEDFDAVFYPGGHGPLWDLVDNKDSIRLIESFWSQGKPVSAACHAPAVLLNARDPQGKLIIKNKKITGFTNSEEAAIGLTDKVPFLLESELIKNGGTYSSADDFMPHVQVDGQLITGQNPASAESVANALIDMIRSE